MNQWLQFVLWLVGIIGTLTTIDNCVKTIANRGKEPSK